MRFAMRVDANQAEIVTALRKAGALVEILSHAGEGVPDLLVGVRGVLHLAEVKDGAKPESGRRLTPKEKAFFDKWRGYPVHVANSAEEALACVGLVDAPRQRARPLLVDVEAVCRHYQTYHPHAKVAVKNSREHRAIESRLAEGFTVAELSKAIDGMHRTPHNLGENERGQKYLGLELCMRTADQVTRFIENADRFGEHRPVLNGRNTLGVQAARAWLERGASAEESTP